MVPSSRPEDALIQWNSTEKRLVVFCLGVSSLSSSGAAAAVEGDRSGVCDYSIYRCPLLALFAVQNSLFSGPSTPLVLVFRAPFSRGALRSAFPTWLSQLTFLCHVLSSQSLLNSLVS